MEKADHAQAQVFLHLLTHEARTLTHEIMRTYGPAAHHLEAELRMVQRYIARLQRRFPDTRTHHPG
ncbi:hypothetical protein [Nocardia sp. NPDC050710]|uniref:hypothetical protein n=1 Tax=Nocardia sp. NPDC050710 TaxID=3157220 RepID=UPI0034029E87